MVSKNKKRVFPAAEEILSRPWCYYCERDFDDLKILISHQKAKHFKCERCGRRLNTAGGLSVHLNQVHKETLTTVENALPNRSNLDVEIFGMEGIPEDVLKAHQQRILGHIQQAEAERTAATGNPAPGGAGGGPKKPRFESPSDLKKRLAEHKAKMAEQSMGGGSGGVTPKGAGQSPGIGSVAPFASTSPPYHAQPQQQEPNPVGGLYGAFAQPFEQAAHQQAHSSFAHQQMHQPSQHQQGFEGMSMMQYSTSGNQYPVSHQYAPHGSGQSFPPQFHGPPRAYGGAVASVSHPYQQQHSPRMQLNPMPVSAGTIPPWPSGLPPAIAGLPQRPAFVTPPVNAFQMQQLHQGQTLDISGPPSNLPTTVGTPNFSDHVHHTDAIRPPIVEGHPLISASAGAATSLDEPDMSTGLEPLTADAISARPSEPGVEKKAKKERRTKLIYSDDTVSPEEKMARLPRYAFDPSKRDQMRDGVGSNAAEIPSATSQSLIAGV